MFESVSYIHVLGGGALIGLSALVLFSGIGRIAGICGIAFSLLAAPVSTQVWRLMFLAGLLIGTFLYHQISGQAFPPAPDTKLPLLIIGGLLVGFGTAMGNGCTSGHGICGLSRFSPRSITATLTFMVFAILSMFVFRHILDWSI
ncbi:YeeE/YedE family protein [Oceaniserpentilla sp. 4NH20-0058]|uniref:YeeE/YedE family protein n=1 Tax=Oceaniserpentilla sp. 4NH20-0058 TaxID=3127660 RepID=UPI00310A9862